MLLKQTLLYLPAQILVPAVQFLAVLVWAYYLTPEDVGIVTLAIAIQELAFAAFFMWWSHYALRYIRSYTGDNRRIFLSAESVALLLAGILQCLVLLPLLSLYTNGKVGDETLLILIFFMVSRSYSSYVSERARAEARILVYSISQLSVSVGGFVIGLGIMAWYKAGADSVLIGYIVSQCLALCAGVACTDLRLSIFKCDFGVLRKAASFGLPVMVASVFSLVSLNAPRFVVEAEQGLAAVGLFAIGYGLGLRASSFAVMLVTAGAYPLVVKKMETEGIVAAYKQLQINMMMVGMVVMPVALGVLAINSSIVATLVAEPYREVTSFVLPLSTIAGLFRYLRSHTTDQVFLLQAKPIIITWFGVADLLVTLLMSYFGAVLFGTVGATVGPLFASFFIYFASLVLSVKRFDFEFPFLKMAKIFLSAFVMFCAVHAVPVADEKWKMVPMVFLGGVVYLSCIAFLMKKEFFEITARVFRRK